MPALAAYAAADAEVFPVDAHMMELDPASTALETAMVIPRSLKEELGLRPSYFRYTEMPGFIFEANLGTGMSGVFPS